MRGGVSVYELLHVYSHEDIELMTDLIKENMENTKNWNMPLV
jgi:hypothetical protein